jgi:4-hydroxybenzoate-CoA ligase
MTEIRDYNAAVDFVDRNVAEGRGEKAAFIDPSRNLTYGELRDTAARIGPMLARMGIEPENRIALVLLDTVDFPVLFWGAIRAGIVPVLVNTQLTVDQYRYLFEDSRAKAVFVSAALLPIIQEAAKDLPNLKTIVVVGGGPPSVPRLDMLLAAENEGSAPTRTSADEVAYWLYSSGTTGMPKGTMHVHSTPMNIARTSGQGRLGIREDDLIFSAPKLFFAYGLGDAMLCPMSVGATTVLYPERPTPQTVFETLRAYQPTMFFAVPTLYAAMLSDPECMSETMPSRLRLCFSAGEPLPAQLGQSWKQRFGLDIVNGVGSTEMGHLTKTARTWPTMKSGSFWYEVKRPQPATGISARNRATRFWVNGPAPATNTCGVRMGCTSTAAAPTTCSRSAAFGSRRSRSRTRWSATPRCSRPLLFQTRTTAALSSQRLLWC